MATFTVYIRLIPVQAQNSVQCNVNGNTMADNNIVDSFVLAAPGKIRKKCYMAC